MPPRPTHAVQVFLEMTQAALAGTPMTPRSANDKEYFAQDWFDERLAATGIPFEQQGRNSYPDFWVGQGGDREGYEVKSLGFSRGRPARKDLDFNSTIPSGQKDGSEVFLVFFLYEGTGANPRRVHTISLAHGDLINCDHLVADEHVNVAIHDFGSYADGFIRNRKMYVFPHPVTLNPDGLGRQRLIVPSAWNIAHQDLNRVETIERTVAPEAVDSYTIRLYGRGAAEVATEPADQAGHTHVFDVFERR